MLLSIIFGWIFGWNVVPDEVDMAKCKQCGIKVSSVGTKPKLFCSDACRKRFTRTVTKRTEASVQTDIINKRTLQTDKIGENLKETVPYSAPNVTENPVSSECSRQSKNSVSDVLAAAPSGKTAAEKVRTLEGYYEYPEWFIPRSEPEKLNWGPWMNVGALAAAGLKANRVAIPGDWDYVGVADG